MTSWSRCSMTYVALGRLTAPPGRHRRQQQLLAEQLAAERRQERQERRRLDHPGAERVGDDDVAGADGIDEPGDAEEGVAAQLQRIAEAVVEAAEDDVDRLQAFERLDEDAAIADRQVAAFDEREAEIAREVGVLEVGLVVAAPASAARPWPVARAPAPARSACRAARGRRRRAAESRQSRNASGRLCEEDDAVLERVAGARRRLRAIGEHRPTGRRARARDRRRACAGRCRAARACRDTGAGTPGWRARARPAAAPLAQQPLRPVADRARIRLSSRVRCISPRFETAPLVRPARGAGPCRAPTVDRCPADRRRRCR